MGRLDLHRSSRKTADLLSNMSQRAYRDVILIAPFDVEYPISFNVLESSIRKNALGRVRLDEHLQKDLGRCLVGPYGIYSDQYIIGALGSAGLDSAWREPHAFGQAISAGDHLAYQRSVCQSFLDQEFANYTERQAAEAVRPSKTKSVNSPLTLDQEYDRSATFVLRFP